MLYEVITVSKVDRSMLGHLSLASFLLELGKVVISRYLIESKQTAVLSENLQKGTTVKQAEIAACGSKSEDVTVITSYSIHYTKLYE